MNKKQGMIKNRGIGLGMVGAIAAVMIAGVVFTWWTVQWTDAELRNNLLRQARILAQAVNLVYVQELSGSEADQEKPEYLWLKEQFAAVKQAIDKCRFIYLVGRLPDGQVFFFLDNEPIGSDDYSGPGDIYEDASDELKAIFDHGIPFVEGPLPDEWGVWVSALVPVFDPQTGRVLAALGIDVDVRDWRWTVVTLATLPLGLMLAVLIFLILSMALARSYSLTRAREAELLESEQKYRHLFELAEEGIVIIRSETIEFANPAMTRMLGRSIDTITASPLVTFIHSEDRDMVLERHRKRMQGEAVNTGDDFRIDTLDGDVRWLRITSQIIDWEGAPASLSFLTDITERKHAEAEREKLQAQLLQAKKMESVGRLAGGVAHDFNNMLSVILGYTEMAMDKIDPSDPLNEDLKEILNAAKRSAEVTRQLLAFAREQTIAPQVLDLNATVESMLMMLRRLIGEDIDLSWRPEAGLLSVNMDPSQIDQILANLCVNARDAIAGVGRITIETANVRFDADYCTDHAGFVPGDFVLLAVSDDGCGMDRQTMTNLFDPFFTTKDVNKGTGLGLATVYGIVKQNDGFINVYSEPGQGTSVKIYLPHHAGQTGQVRPKNAEQIPSGHGEAVLIVEDEVAMLMLGKSMLERLGYTVLTAATPGEAIRLAEAHAGRIHLLLTDVVMPEMNGRDLAEQLMELYPNLKLLFMSGYTANVIAPHGVLEDGMQFIQKPFAKQDLAIKVREVLDETKLGPQG